MKNLKATIFGLLLSLALVSPVMAKKCHTVYGGGEVCETCRIRIDKEIWNPAENAYWDNIDSNDYTFKAGEEVKFKMVVKNISDFRVDNIKVEDSLPDYLVFSSSKTDSGHNLEYRSDGHYVIYFLGGLDKNEEELIELRVKVKNENDIPVGISPLTNKAKVYSDDQCSDTDYVNMAISREGKAPVLGAKAPETGSNSMILMAQGIGFLVMAGAYGYVLRKQK